MHPYICMELHANFDNGGLKLAKYLRKLNQPKFPVNMV